MKMDGLSEMEMKAKPQGKGICIGFAFNDLSCVEK
jgi:hypothetical protein